MRACIYMKHGCLWERGENVSVETVQVSNMSLINGLMLTSWILIYLFVGMRYGVEHSKRELEER